MFLGIETKKKKNQDRSEESQKRWGKRILNQKMMSGTCSAALSTLLRKMNNKRDATDTWSHEKRAAKRCSVPFIGAAPERTSAQAKVTRTGPRRSQAHRPHKAI